MNDRNPRVFFDIEINGVYAGRLVMELFADTTPKAAEKFRALCTGENGIGNHGRPLHLKGSCIYGLYGLKSDLMGGFDHQCRACCDTPFEEEYYAKSHSGPGYLFFPEEGAMYFNISLQETWHVVFGKIVDGMDLLKSMQRVSYWEQAEPAIIIVNCGQLKNKCINPHKLKNYGPKYHNLKNGSKIPHQYVYRSEKGRDPNSRVLL